MSKQRPLTMEEVDAFLKHTSWLRASESSVKRRAFRCVVFLRERVDRLEAEVAELRGEEGRKWRDKVGGVKK